MRENGNGCKRVLARYRTGMVGVKEVPAAEQGSETTTTKGRYHDRAPLCHLGPIKKGRVQCAIAF
jgi:hypothetical protein